MAGTKIRGVTIELKADTAGILDGIKDLNSSLGKTDKALKDVNKLLKFDGNNTELLAQQQTYLNEAIEKTEEKLRKEKELLEQLKSADNADETREQQNALAREIEATSQKLNEYKSQLNQTDNALEDVTQETKEASEHTLTFGDVIKANLVSGVIVAGIKKIAEGIKEIATSAMSVGMEFESSMSQVAATMGMTTAEIQAGSEAYNMLADAARQCGATTMYTASQAADALNYLALAGYDAQKAAETLPKVLTLAAAGGMDLAYASDLITDAMSAMGMSTEDLDKYLDEMTRTAQKANTSVSQLGEATLVCAGTVTLTGQSLETMNTELGILANNGIKGAEGGTHLRNILLSLSAPTDKASDAIENLGLKISDSKGNMRDLNDIMLDLNAALEGMGSAEKTSVIKSIFNKTDIAAVNALMKGSVEEFGNLKEKIEDCEGAAQAMADTMMDNLQGKITILKSALEGLGVTFYDIFDDDAKKAVGAATDAIDELQDAMKNGELGVSLQELSDAFGDLADDLINWAKDALPDIIDGVTWFIEHLPQIVDLLETVGFALGAYKIATLAATIATIDFTAAFEANPIGLAAAAIVGLTTAIVTFGKTVTEEANKFPNAIQENVDALDNIKTSYTESSAKAAELAETIKTLNGIEHLNADQKIELASAVQQWNEMVDENSQLLIDDTGHIIDNTDALYDNIDAALAAYQLELKKEELAELTRKYAEAKELEAQAEKERAEAYEEYIRAQEYGSNVDVYALDILQQKGALLKECRENTREYAEEYDNLTEQIRNETEAQKESNEATKEGTSANGEYADSLGDVSEELEKLRENLEQTIEAQVSQFDRLKEGTSIAVNDINENLQHNIDVLDDWADNIKILADRGINEGLLQTLIDMGPEGAAQMQAFVDATDAELEEAGALWEESILKSTAIANSAIAEAYYNDGTSAADSFIQGATESLDETSGQIPEALVGKIVEDENWERLPEEVKTNIIESMLAASEELADDDESAGGIPESLVGKIVEDENWERLPEEVKEKIIESLLIAQEGIVEEDETGTIIADNIDDGFIEETEARAEEVGQAIQTGVVDPTINTMNEQFQTAGPGQPSQVFINYGMSIPDSLKQGVETNTPVVLLPALAKMCEDSLLQVQVSLGWDGGKFQKFYEVGLKVDESIANGIEDNAGMIASALQSAFDEAISSIDFSGLSSMINVKLGAALGG